MDCLITCLFEHPWQSKIVLFQPLPIPFIRSVLIPVVTFGIDPIGRMMAGCILPCHDGCTGRRTHTLGIKSREADSLLCQFLHIRRMIPIIQRMTHNIPLCICQERQRCVHYSHIVHQEKYDIGAFLSRHGQREGEQQCFY